MPQSTKAIVGAVIAALSFLAGAVTVDGRWSDLGAPWIVIGALLALFVGFNAVYWPPNGASSSPETSTPGPWGRHVSTSTPGEGVRRVQVTTDTAAEAARRQHREEP